MSEGLVVAVRAIIGFFTLLIFTKLLGKEQISQLTYFDYSLGITIGSIAASLTTDLSSRAWPHWVGLLVWALLGFLMEFLTMKWRFAAKYIEGEPTIIIMEGKIMEKALRKMKYRASDVMELLRNKDIFDITEVDFAIVEPNGVLSVLKKAENLPLTVKDMNIKKQNSGISTELIYDGMLIDENLIQLNKDKQWLVKELNKQGIKDISEVFLAALNPAGSLYIDRYEDHIKKIIDVGDYKGPY